MKRRKGIGLEPHVFPNGREYVFVYLNDDQIGCFDVKPGGYIVTGCFKPCRTRDEAVRKILIREAKKARAEAARYEKALADLPGVAD